MMRLKAWIGGFFGTSAQAPAALGSVAVATQPAPVAQRDLLSLYLMSDDLRKVIDRVSESVGQQRWRVIRKGKELPDHPLAVLLRAPSSQLSGPAHRALTTLYLDLLGESFDLILPSDRRGLAHELAPVPPSTVTVKDGEIQVAIGSRIFDVPDGGYAWIKRVNPSDPYGRGIGPAYAVVEDALTGDAAAKWTNAFFRNGARPDLIFSMPGATQDVIGRAKSDWNARYQGAVMAHQAAFLGGDWKVQELQKNVKDLALPDVRRVSSDAIRELYGVPPELFGQLASSNRATITEARQIFAEFVVLPRLEFLKREWEARLLPLLGYTDVELDFDSPLPADIEGRRLIMSAHPHAFTVNEVRREAGLPARADGEVYLRTAADLPVPAAPIQDLTDQARLIEPPPLPSGPVLYLLSGDTEGALERALLTFADQTTTALALVRWRRAVDEGRADELALARDTIKTTARALGACADEALRALMEAA